MIFCQCLSHSWYSAVDVQLYLVSPFLIYILYYRPKSGKTVLYLLIISSSILTAVLTIINHYPAVPYFNDLVPLSIMNSYYRNIYIKPYCRIGPYLIGILLAEKMLSINALRSPIKISVFSRIVGWSFTILATVGIIVIMMPANQGNLPSVHLAALYSGTARIVWTMGLCWVTFALQNDYGGLLGTVLCSKTLIPLSRLTYCAYLVHPLVIATFYGSRAQSFDFSTYLIVSHSNPVLAGHHLSNCFCLAGLFLYSKHCYHVYRVVSGGDLYRISVRFDESSIAQKIVTLIRRSRLFSNSNFTNEKNDAKNSFCYVLSIV